MSDALVTHLFAQTETQDQAVRAAAFSSLADWYDGIAREVSQYPAEQAAAQGNADEDLASLFGSSDPSTASDGNEEVGQEGEAATQGNADENETASPAA